MSNKIGVARVSGLLLLVMAMAGCDDSELLVQRYPVFYDAAIKTVAVLPFENHSLHPMAGTFLADRLGDSLRANATYKVITPKELAGRMSAAGVIMPTKAGPEQMAETLRKLEGIDAFLTGTVTRFGAGQGTYTEVYDDPWIDRGYYGGYYGRHHHRGYYGGGYGRGYYPVYRRYTYSQAHVSASARMYRVADAGLIYASTAPIAARLTSTDGISPLVDEVLAETADIVARDIVATFAIVPRILKLDEDDVLRPAIRKSDGQLKYTTDFRPGDDGIYIVVSLPPAADRNNFRLAVARKKQPPIAEQPFTWDRAEATREFFFALPSVAETGGGKGDYQVRLYSGDTVEMERKIKIKD